MAFLILLTLFASPLYQPFFGDGLALPEMLTNPPDNAYFDKYGPCVISASRLHDAYYVEGKLASTIIKGLINLQDMKYEQDHPVEDDILKRAMYETIQMRYNESAADNFTNNPINALNFVTRIVTHFNPVLNNIFQSETMMKLNFYKDLSAVVDRYIREQSCCWPTSRDLIIVAKSISRISSTYNLSKKGLLDGYVYNHSSFEPLSIDQAIALTQEANRNSHFNDVLDWVQFLLKNVSAKEDHTRWQKLIKIKASALFQKKQINDAISVLDDAIKDIHTDPKVLKRDLDFYKSKMTDNDASSIAFDEKEINYSELCRKVAHSNKDIGLRCYYRQIGTAYDRVKMEMISRDPPAYKYYGIINEEETLHLFDLIKTKKIRMYTNNEKEGIIEDEKLSREMAFVWDDDHTITRRLSKRISYLTKLDAVANKYNTKMSSGSPFQIINYGIGGYVDRHVDYLAHDQSDKRKDISAFGGDRMATWMYHLSGKVEGGHLVFMKSNVTVQLEKGSGILFFNLFKNGTVNPSSEYMECPVILGSKWIATKYIHENGNMFTRKCQRARRSFFF